MNLTAEQQKICIECGECCRWMTFTLDVIEAKRRQKFIEFYKARGCTIKTSTGDVVVMIPHICPHLKEDGCDAVVLGCTEIPLIVTPESSPLPTLDSTRLLARAALKKAIET